MKILSPLKSLDEVGPLCEAGADQFYCGIISDDPLNDRPNTSEYNFNSKEDFIKATVEITKRGKEIFLALNSPTADMNQSLFQAKMAYESGAGVIISNLLLMQKVHQLFPKIKIYASCLTGTLNSEGVNFLSNLGATGIHLPRHLGFEDLRRIRPKVPKTELSVFGFEGRCVNIEAFCALHDLVDGSERQFVPCKYFEVSQLSNGCSLDSKTFSKKINLPKYSCGICGIKQLKAIGIDVIKIEGRGFSKERKIAHIRTVKEALEIADNLSQDMFEEKCKNIFVKNMASNCESSYCYF